MKKIAVTLFALLLLVVHNPTYAQNKLNKILGYNMGVDISSKHFEFVDANVGWIIDVDGVRKTNDGGKSWEIQVTFDRDRYLDFTGEADFIDNLVGYFTLRSKSSNGTNQHDVYLFKTLDGGNSWIRNEISGSNLVSNSNVRVPTFINKDHGFAINDFWQSSTGPKAYQLIRTTNGGSSWEVLNEDLPQITQLYFDDQQNGWAISADKRTIIRTTDGGFTWAEVQIEGASYYLDISTIGSKIWVKDWYGLFFSSDNGTNWVNINPQVPDGSPLIMFDEMNGLIHGYVTADGGYTWTKKDDVTYLGSSDKNNVWFWPGLSKTTDLYDSSEMVFPMFGPYHSIRMLNDNIIIIAHSDGAIIRSADGGKTWTAIWDIFNLREPGYGFGLGGIAFADDVSGVAVGTHRQFTHAYDLGFIAQTTDAGATWQQVLNYTEESVYNSGISSVAYSNGSFLAKSYGKMLKSVDGGFNWSGDESSGVNFGFLNNMQFHGNTGFGIGASDGSLYKTTDSGLSWTEVLTGSCRNLTYVSDNLIYVSADVNMNKSTDGGNSWENMEWPNIHSELALFHDSMFGIAPGTGGPPYDRGTYMTEDGGQSWSLIYYSESGGGRITPLAMDFRSPDKGFIIARDDLYTTNSYGVIDTSSSGGGEPEQRVVIDEKFDDAQFPPNGWTVNQTHQTNTWIAGNITDQNFSSIDPTNVNSAFCPWIAEDQDEWLITPSFSLASGAATIEFYAGYSTDWLSAATLKLQISVDGGTNWTQIWEALNDGQPWGWRYQNVDITQYANNSEMKLAWQYVGNDGDVAAVDNVKLTGFVTVTDVEEEHERIPIHYELSQNYPNPFNPSTKISYSIPNSGKVMLVIYDVLGREVKTLVNQEQNAGKYTIDFNAERLSSGVYFYRLSADKFSETRKLLLLR